LPPFTGGTRLAEAAANCGGGLGTSSGALTVTSSTFSGNSASAGGSLYHFGGFASLAGNLLASNASGANCSGTLTDNGYNLSDDGSCGFSGAGSANNASLPLGTLTTGDPGQQVHIPAALSAAIGAIPRGTTVNNNGVMLACDGSTTDQLGSERPITAGNACTSGA